jgi:hypothetical protein
MFPSTLIELVARIKKRRNERFGHDVQMVSRFAELEQEFPVSDLPWYWLSLAINNPADESESPVERMCVRPWDSTDPEISQIWRFISSSENLENLEKRQAKGNLNKEAQESLDRALASARREG